MSDAGDTRGELGLASGSTARPAFSRASLRILGVLLVFRLLAAVLIAPDIAFDAQGYVESARRLITNGSFAYPLYADEFWRHDPDGGLVFREEARDDFHSTPPNAYVMPGYPVFVAAIWVGTGFGADPGLPVRVAQALLSVLTAALIYLIARRKDERTALVALGICVLYPPFTLANSYLHMEVLYSFLLTAGVFLFLRWIDSRSLTSAIVAGLVLGAGALVRPTGLPWVALALVAVVLIDHAEWRKRVVQAVALGVAVMCVLAPWAVRNHALYGEPVLFGTSASVNVAFGIWQDAQEPFVPAWRHGSIAPPSSSELAAVAQSVFNKAPRTTYDDFSIHAYHRETSRELLRVALTDHAFAVVSTRLRSVGASLTWPHAVSPQAYGGAPFTVSWIVHCALLAFAILGMTRLGHRIDLWLVASVPLYFVFAHAIIFPLWRHYFPSLTLVCVLAAIGVLVCYDSLRARAR